MNQSIVGWTEEPLGYVQIMYVHIKLQFNIGYPAFVDTISIIKGLITYQLIQISLYYQTLWTVMLTATQKGAG